MIVHVGDPQEGGEGELENLRGGHKSDLEARPRFEVREEQP